MKRASQVVLGSVLAGLLAAIPTMADEGHDQKAETASAAESSQATAARDELEAIKAELEELRATVELLKPSVAQLMPDFAERFHVMHRAGAAGDWAVAQHEMLEMRHIIELSKEVEPERGAMLEAFMDQPFKDLDSAIEHADREAFEKVLVRTVDNCNACHRAVGSPFVEVVLNARSSLSMRHPHKLQRSQPPDEHTHGPSGSPDEPTEEMHEEGERHMEGDEHPPDEHGHAE